MIGECEYRNFEEVPCAGQPRSQAALARHNRTVMTFLYEKQDMFFWEHSPDKYGGIFWYCRECHVEILFRKLTKGEM